MRGRLAVKPSLFVTGASGFAGRRFLRIAGDRYRLICLVRRPSAFVALPGFDGEIVSGDLRDPPDISRSVRGVAAVVHLGAALLNQSPREIYRVNVEGTRLLVSACLDALVPHFVFASSEYVSRPWMKDPYTESKRVGEELVGNLASVAILRPCTMYGPGDHRGLGRFVDLAKRTGFVPAFGGLTRPILPLHVDDFAECILRCVDRRITGRFTLAGPEQITFNDLVRSALAKAGIKARAVRIPRALWSSAAEIGERLPFTSGWNRGQYAGVYTGQPYSIEDATAILGRPPRGIATGLKETPESADNNGLPERRDDEKWPGDRPLEG